MIVSVTVTVSTFDIIIITTILYKYIYQLKHATEYHQNRSRAKYTRSY
jgi:hypothetical protein